MSEQRKKRRLKANPHASRITMRFTEEQWRKLLMLSAAETEGNVSALIRKRLFRPEVFTSNDKLPSLKK